MQLFVMMTPLCRRLCVLYRTLRRYINTVLLLLLFSTTYLVHFIFTRISLNLSTSADGRLLAVCKYISTLFANLVFNFFTQ